MKRSFARWFFPFWITFCGGILGGWIVAGGSHGLSPFVACALGAAVFGCWSVGVDALFLESRFRLDSERIAYLERKLTAGAAEALHARYSDVPQSRRGGL